VIASQTIQKGGTENDPRDSRGSCDYRGSRDSRDSRNALLLVFPAQSVLIGGPETGIISENLGSYEQVRFLQERRAFMSNNRRLNQPDRNGIELGDVLPSEYPTPLQQLLQKELYDQVRAAVAKALAQCREEDREVFEAMLRWTPEPRSRTEVAEELGLSRNGFRQRYIKASTRFANLLKLEFEAFDLTPGEVPPALVRDSVAEWLDDDEPPAGSLAVVLTPSPTPSAGFNVKRPFKKSRC